jgi:flagellar biosynthesis protein FliQ
MSIGLAVYIFRSGVFQILLLSAPMLIIGMAVGLIISILQATTSIQEQTLSFVPKIAAILLSLILFGPWMFTTLMQYTEQLFARIPDMVQ